MTHRGNKIIIIKFYFSYLEKIRLNCPAKYNNDSSFTLPYFMKICLTLLLFISLQITAQVNHQSPIKSTNDTTIPRLKQLSNGLHGYISMNLPKQKEGYGYGISFYVTAWPLLEKPLSGFQIGLPGTWIVPDNRGYELPLCPPGTYARDHWDQRGPSYRDVFQTIEGSLGFWGSTQFGEATAKFRMNGTANCYNQEVSSPGWGFGQTKSLKAADMGMAQLSNHLLVPPDGITFMKGTSGEVLGNAWMALPLMPARPKEGNDVPTGDLSWTCFLNASNFKGPVAFYIPALWSKIAIGNPNAEGRGLDTREGVPGSGAIEINTVPKFENTDSKGNVYTRIPRLQFPVDDRGITMLMQDATLYSKGALFNQLATALNEGSKISLKFAEGGSFAPECNTRSTRYDQGPEAMTIRGINEMAKPVMLDKSSYGLQWHTKNGMAYFPEYFKKEGDQMIAITADEVPDETFLKQQVFAPARKGKPYVSPFEEKGAWSSPGPKAGPFQAMLSDGSVVTYYWYKFIDQPSLQSISLNVKEKEEVQHAIELIHKAENREDGFMPLPTKGKLATLDKAMIVNPPKGLEYGYVPVVIRQEASEK